MRGEDFDKLSLKWSEEQKGVPAQRRRKLRHRAASELRLECFGFVRKDWNSKGLKKLKKSTAIV